MFCSAIILITCLSYSNSIQNPFLFDDEIVIKKNKNITSLTNIKYLFSIQYFSIFEERTWRPFTTLFYMANYKLWGLYAPMWKIVSIVIHAVNGIFLYLILRKYYSELTAFFAGVMFVLLPVNSEVINCLSLIKDSLSLFFGLISFMLFIRAYFLLSLAAFLFSLASKEMAVILPALFILYDMCIGGYKEKELLKRIKTVHTRYWIILFIFLVMYFARFQNPYGGDEYFGGTFPLWLLNLPLIIFQDIKLLFSIWQNVDHVVEPLGVKALFLWIPLILTAFTFTVIWRQDKPQLFFFIWLIICLIPISGIVQLDQVIADRYL